MLKAYTLVQLGMGLFQWGGARQQDDPGSTPDPQATDDGSERLNTPREKTSSPSPSNVNNVQSDGISDMSDGNNQFAGEQQEAPVLTFEGKRYDLNGLPDDIKQLIRGMQVADNQLRMTNDTLKVLAFGRQSMAHQLNERLKTINPLPEAANE